MPAAILRFSSGRDYMPLSFAEGVRAPFPSQFPALALPCNAPLSASHTLACGFPFANFWSLFPFDPFPSRLYCLLLRSACSILYCFPPAVLTVHYSPKAPLSLRASASLPMSRQGPR